MLSSDKIVTFVGVFFFLSSFLFSFHFPWNHWNNFNLEPVRLDSSDLMLNFFLLFLQNYRKIDRLWLIKMKKKKVYISFSRKLIDLLNPIYIFTISHFYICFLFYEFYFHFFSKQNSYIVIITNFLFVAKHFVCRDFQNDTWTYLFDFTAMQRNLINGTQI